MDRWRGKVALVTGASSGIGARLVERLVREGLVVVGLARRLDRMQQLNLGGNFHPFKCDLTKEHDILEAFRFVETIGPLHVLVNNAGYLKMETIVDGSTDTMRRCLEVNVLAPAICAREASRLMKKHNVKGHMINVNSVAGHNAAILKAPVGIYPASKYAVTGMSQTLRNELSGRDIRVTSISPGATRTDMLRQDSIPAEILEKFELLEAEDVVGGIIYALSAPNSVQVDELTISPLNEFRIVAAVQKAAEC